MLPGNGLGPVRLLIRYQYYSVWNGGGWRAAMSLVGFLCLPLFYIVTLADILLSAAEKSSTEVFTDPCAAPLTEAPPRMLHGGGGGGNGDEVLSDIALVLGSMACSFLAVAASAVKPFSNQSPPRENTGDSNLLIQRWVKMRR